MPDGRFDSALYQSFVAGQVSASDLACDHETVPAHPVVLRLWLAASAAAVALCALHLA